MRCATTSAHATTSAARWPTTSSQPPRHSPRGSPDAHTPPDTPRVRGHGPPRRRVVPRADRAAVGDQRPHHRAHRSDGVREAGRTVRAPGRRAPGTPTLVLERGVSLADRLAATPSPVKGPACGVGRIKAQLDEKDAAFLEAQLAID